MRTSDVSCTMLTPFSSGGPRSDVGVTWSVTLCLRVDPGPAVGFPTIASKDLGAILMISLRGFAD